MTVVRMTLFILVVVAEWVAFPSDSLSWVRSMGEYEGDQVVASGEGESGTGDDSLQFFIEALEESTGTLFGEELLSLPVAEAESLTQIYEETGQSPAESLAARRPGAGISFGLRGFRYNRVEGLNLWPGVALAAPTEREIGAFGEIGYGWSSKMRTWRVGVRAQLTPGWGKPTVEVLHARDVYGFDAGLVPGNSLFAILAGKDYHDYYRGEGWSARLSVAPGPLHLAAAYRAQREESLENQDPFSLLRGKGDFRANPPIDDGRMREAELELGWMDLNMSPLAALITASVADHGMGGDFEFERLKGELALRRFLWFGDEIVLRISAGSVRGEVPFQRLHHLGGLTRLRGYEVNEFPARRFSLMCLDYKVGTDLLGRLPGLGWLRPQLVPFFDAAAFRELQRRDGAAVKLDDTDWRSSAGVGIQMNPLGIPSGVGQLRLDIVRRLDRSDDNMRYRVLITSRR